MIFNDLTQLWAVAIYVLATLAILGLMVGLAYLLGGRARAPSKNDPFESGMLPTGTAEIRMSAKFYLVAVFFVIFDIEALYLFAWAVSIRESGWLGFIEALIFVTVLLVGLIYLWRMGALNWSPKSSKKTL